MFTNAAPPPAAVVAAQVQVAGTVAEFVPSADPLQPPLTELTTPTVVQLSTGNPLPAPIPLTSTFPDPAGPHDQLERVEGMRVSVASLTVTRFWGDVMTMAGAVDPSSSPPPSSHATSAASAARQAPERRARMFTSRSFRRRYGAPAASDHSSAPSRRAVLSASPRLP